MKKKPDHLRTVTFERRFTRHAEGSVLIKQGETWVLCTASVEERVPPFLRGSGRGGHRRAACCRVARLSARARDQARKPDARGSEIARLTPRARRRDMQTLGERTITIDCDVLQADGGTRCASITGGMVALADAVAWMRRGLLTPTPSSSLSRRSASASAMVCLYLISIMRTTRQPMSI